MALNYGRNIVSNIPEAIATYDYVDIAEGTGIVVFHGGSVRSTSGGFKYVLSRNTFYSDQIASGGDNTGTDDLKVLDVDFDVTFKNPQIVEGKSLISIPISVNGNVAASSYDAYVTCAVQQVREGVETELFALTSGSLIHSAESYQFRYSTIPATLPRTLFREDDTLRLQVQLYVRGNAADAGFGLIGMDPNNRTESGATSSNLKWIDGASDLQFHVPFRLTI